MMSKKELAEISNESHSMTCLELCEVYGNSIGIDAEMNQSNALILESYKNYLKSGIGAQIDDFLKEFPFVSNLIRHKADRHQLYRQAAMPFIYLMVHNAPSKTKENWPLLETDLEPVYSDLGKSFEAY